MVIINAVTASTTAAKARENKQKQYKKDRAEEDARDKQEAKRARREMEDRVKPKVVEHVEKALRQLEADAKDGKNSTEYIVETFLGVLNTWVQDYVETMLLATLIAEEFRGEGRKFKATPKFKDTSRSCAMSEVGSWREESCKFVVLVSW